MMKKQEKEDESKPETEIYDKDLKKINDESNDFSIHDGETKKVVQKKITQ